jgi:hypothetical protein
MRKQIARKVLDLANEAVVIRFTDGREVSLNLSDINQELRTYAALHGLNQKLGDSYAGAESIDEAFSNASDVAQSLREGEWNRKGGYGGGDLAQAISNLTGKDLAEVIEVLGKMNDEARKAIRKRKDVAAEIAKIQAERKAAAAESSEDSGDLTELF